MCSDEIRNFRNEVRHVCKWYLPDFLSLGEGAILHNYIVRIKQGFGKSTLSSLTG